MGFQSACEACADCLPAPERGLRRGRGEVSGRVPNPGRQMSRTEKRRQQQKQIPLLYACYMLPIGSVRVGRLPGRRRFRLSFFFSRPFLVLSCFRVNFGKNLKTKKKQEISLYA